MMISSFCPIGGDQENITSLSTTTALNISGAPTGANEHNTKIYYAKETPALILNPKHNVRKMVSYTVTPWEKFSMGNFY